MAAPTDNAPPSTPEGTTIIAILAQRLGALWDEHQRLDRQAVGKAAAEALGQSQAGDAERRRQLEAAMAERLTAIDDLERLIATAPARSVADAAVQAALIRAGADRMANGATPALRREARTLVEGMAGSVFRLLAGMAGPDLDRAAVRRYLPSALRPADEPEPA